MHEKKAGNDIIERTQKTHKIVCQDQSLKDNLIFYEKEGYTMSCGAIP